MGRAPLRPAVLFDLDGTLTDPFVGITSSIRHALAGLGRPAPEADELRWCIGPPLELVFATLLETDDEAAVAEAVRLYRERYMRVGKFENRLIEGVPDVLAGLRRKGLALHIATSKLQSHAGDILEHFGIERFFDGLHGALPDGTNADKAPLVARILATRGVAAERAVMVGDRSHDIAGAAANGVAAIGVLWGYGDRAKLERAGARAIAARPPELPVLIDRIPETA